MKTSTPYQQAPQDTLIFIPDISGFTKFVNNTEIQHSQHIIEELLEILIDANEIDLEISEIEGDAILFYRNGKAPTAAELLTQVQRMYTKFHAHLKKYETHRICQCGACSTANDLTLKFVAHFGVISMKQVKNYSKLFGRDVIVAHRLMKNNIDSDEYVMFTNPLTKACATWVQLDQVAWSDPIHSKQDYDVGTVNFCHLPLEPLMDHIPEPQLKDYSIPGADDFLVGREKTIEAPLDLVFDVVSDMSFRHHWFHGLKGGDKFNHKVTQVGSTHRCIIKGEESDPFFVMHDYKINQDVITFVETNHKEKYSAVFSLRRIGKGLTKVELHYYTKPNFLKKLIFNLLARKKTQAQTNQHLINLNEYCKKLMAEEKQHPNRIMLEPERQAA